MDSERGAMITVGDEQYELILTTRATKEIAARYGGLDALGEKLLQPGNTEAALIEVVWLVVTLANQSIMADNLRKNKPPRELLTENVVELLTTPYDLVAFKDAIMDAMNKGTKRNIESAPVEDVSNPPSA
jgi:hypothetical protein